jgi:hypothetical protein
MAWFTEVVLVGILGVRQVRQPRMSIRRNVYFGAETKLQLGLCTARKKNVQEYTPNGEYPGQ